MNYWKIGLGIAVLAGVGWIGWSVTRPVPGIRMADQGREHVSFQEVTAFKYNSNPPTSGQHLPTWVKAGVYDTPQSEGELIHSLEHGYIIINYNCNVHLSEIFNFQFLIFNQFSMFKFQNVFAHEESASAGASADKDGSASALFKDSTIATGSAVNETDGCKTLVKQLGEVANKKKLWKLIVVPRPQLDATIALTAWTYIDTFDTFDAGRIERFTDYHRDQGPEKTME